MSIRLKQRELHKRFLQDIGENVSSVEDNGCKPLMCRLTTSFNRNIKAYIFNCTAPPGGRSMDEYKVQLILQNQKRGERGAFDDSDGRTILIIGDACIFDEPDTGLWVLFELDKHREFAYSANIQIYLRQLLKALETDVFVYKKHNDEVVVIAKRKYLKEALHERFKIDFEIMLERAEHGIKGI